MVEQLKKWTRHTELLVAFLVFLFFAHATIFAFWGWSMARTLQKDIYAVREEVVRVCNRTADDAETAQKLSRSESGGPERESLPIVIIRPVEKSPTPIH